MYCRIGRLILPFLDSVLVGFMLIVGHGTRLRIHPLSISLPYKELGIEEEEEM